MKPSTRVSLTSLCLALLASGEVFARSACDWSGGISGELEHNIDLKHQWVGRDAPIGSVIGQAETYYSRPNEAGLQVICSNFMAEGPTLTANVNNTQPLFTGSLPPINGEDLTGRVIQTGVDGIGIHVRLVAPYHGKGGSPSNAWTYINWTSVPWQGYADHDPGPTGIQLNNLRAYITLIKTGPIAPGPHSFNGIQLFSGTYSDVGTVMRAHLHGTVTTAQCTLKANAVSPAPVDLGTHDVKDFGKPDDFTKAVPFRITLNDCESDASGGTQAYIRLDGANGSKPIDVDKGVFSLSSGSGATGIGIQVLHADGSPFRLEEEVAVMPLSPGDLTLNFQARYYQTAPTVTPGEANGALNFTVTYR